MITATAACARHVPPLTLATELESSTLSHAAQIYRRYCVRRVRLAPPPLRPISKRQRLHRKPVSSSCIFGSRWAKRGFGVRDLVTAAGLDTRCLRLPCLAGGAVAVFECDYDEVICSTSRMIDLAPKTPLFSAPHTSLLPSDTRVQAPKAGGRIPPARMRTRTSRYRFEQWGKRKRQPHDQRAAGCRCGRGEGVRDNYKCF